MEATIIYNPIWEYRSGKVVREEVDFVTVRIQDSYNKKLSYDVRFPRQMVQTYLPVAKA